MDNNEIINIITECEVDLKDMYTKLEDICMFNQEKVLNIYRKHEISYRHFNPTNGYGYDDVGRDTLRKVYADIFGCEDAIVSPYITCGSHALSLALLGVLDRQGKKMLSISGKPYDTLDEVIFGRDDKDIGSLKDLGVEYQQVELVNGAFDLEAIKNKLLEFKPDMVYIQRSRGYLWRDALSIDEIKRAVDLVRSYDKDVIIMLDNCYGEFTQKQEPTEIGVDLLAGSLIKNLGGGLAPTGGYIAGKSELIEKISYRMISPSLGLEVGSFMGGYQLYYQGLFMAPHVVMQALKGSLLFSTVFRKLGYKVLPNEGVMPNDIITSIELGSEEKLINFCKVVQHYSPIDSFVTPEPWEMPGYTNKVIMSAGTFNQGASLELSCDAPVKKPYIIYMQGGLTYEHVKLVLKEVLKNL